MRGRRRCTSSSVKRRFNDKMKGGSDLLVALFQNFSQYISIFQQFATVDNALVGRFGVMRMNRLNGLLERQYRGI